jgi:DDE superfamily endonuclease
VTLGRVAGHDPEDARGEVADRVLACEPLRGWRQVTVTERRTGVDRAHCAREIVGASYPDAEEVVLVLDQLNTHTGAALHEAFPPAEAMRIAERLAIHHTPKYGSWLTMAEIGFSVLARQCLGQVSRIDRRFTAADAHSKLKHRYPITLTRECGTLPVSEH